MSVSGGAAGVNPHIGVKGKGYSGRPSHRKKSDEDQQDQGPLPGYRSPSQWAIAMLARLRRWNPDRKIEFTQELRYRVESLDVRLHTYSRVNR